MPSTARSRGLGLVLVLALATACADQPSPTAAVDTPFSGLAQTASVDVVVGPYTITITDLGVLPGGTYSSAYTLNNTGLIAGVASSPTVNLGPALWRTGTITAIPNYNGAGVLIPVRTNDAGEVILNEDIGGTSINYAIWRDAGGAYHRLPPFPGGDSLRVTARGINTSGRIVGMVREPNLTITTHGVLWQNGAFLQDIGALSGYASTNPQDINDAGSVVGISTNTTNFNSTAFLWQAGGFTNLGALSAGAASAALALNNTGTIVGTSNGGFPVRWVNGAIQSLPVPAGVIQPTPVDVNDAGDIVGWGTSTAPGVLYASAFWRNGQAILLPPWPGATQTLARSINNNAEIVGEGPLVPGGPVHALSWKITTGGTPGNTAPVATLAATTSTTIRLNGSVRMAGTFTDPDNGPWRYSFIWGNGKTSGTSTTAGTITATRKYTKRGTFTVRMLVTDAQGAADTSNVVTVTVR